MLKYTESSTEKPIARFQRNQKNEDIDGARRSPLRDLLEWLEECIEILLDEEASALSDAPRSILSTAPSGTFGKKEYRASSRNTEITKSAKGPKLQGAFAENALEIKYFEQKTSVA